MIKSVALFALLGVAVLAACGGDPPDQPRVADYGPAQHLDEEKVPADLNHLVPLAEQAAFMYMQLALEEMTAGRPRQ